MCPISNAVWASGYVECFSYTLQTRYECYSSEEHNGFILPDEFYLSQLGKKEDRREKITQARRNKCAASEAILIH